MMPGRSSPRRAAVAMVRALLLASSVSITGCSRARNEPAPHAGAPPAVTTDADADADAALARAPPPRSDAGAPPVIGEWLQKIDLPDSGFAYVTPPLGARDRRPIVVAVHGAGDDPGYMCSAWRSITDGFPFVVCPAATHMPSGKYTWGSSEQIEKRVLQAIAAAEARWPENIAVGGPVVYVAFSQGATLAGPVLTRHADRLSRVVLTEGGHGVFDDRAARAFARGGGERVVLSCSTGGCAGGFTAAVATLTRANVQAKIDDAGPLGHSIPPQARESLNRRLPFLIEGLRGWEGYANHPRQTAH